MKKTYSVAKIAIPDPRGVVPRQRLFGELDRAMLSPLIWISAPGGSGKTSLVSSYLKERKLPSIWYHIDAGDADTASFFYYMGLAVQKAAPRYKISLPLLTPEYLPGIKTFTSRYFEQLYARLLARKPHNYTIVFDNYQDVPDDCSLHEILNTGLEMIPEGINVVIISRNEPSAHFTRLLANNKLYHIGWDKIRFDIDETEKFIQNRKENVPDTDIGSMYELTGGWAAGLVLMCNKGNMAVAENIDTREDIFNYFANEIFKRADTRTQEFLMKTAFLPDMNVLTAEKLTDETSSNHILSQLKKNNYFIQQQTASSLSYRYHPLFREFLLSTAKDRFDDNELKQIQQKAALLIGEAGDIEGALQLFASSSDWGNVIKIILSHAQVLIMQGRNRTLIEWINNLPENVRNNNSWLLYWLAVALSPFDPGKSRVLFSQALQIFESQQQNTGTLLAWSGIVQSTLFEFHDFRPLEPWITWFENYTQNNISFPSPEVEISVIGGITGILAYTKPGLNNKEYWLKRALQLCRENHNPDISVRIYTNLLFYHIWMGEFTQADILLHEMNSILKLYPASPLRQIIAKIAEAMLYNSTSDHYHQATDSISDGLNVAEKTGVHLMSSMLFLHGTIGFLNQNDIKNAKEFLVNMERMTGKKHLHLCLYYFISAWYELITGDVNKAVMSAQKSVQLVEMVNAPFIETILRLTLANASYANGDIETCRTQLDITKELISQTGSSYDSYLYYLTEAYYAFEQKKDGCGINALRSAMMIGQHNNYATMVYFWRPDIVSYLCTKALEYNIAPEYAVFLIKKRGLIPQKPVEKWPYPVRIFTLGGFGIVKDDKPVELSTSNGKSQQKPLELLKAIIAMGSRNVLSDRISDTLWPDMEGDAAYNALTTTLQRLRSLLGSPKTILLQDGKISLNPACVWVDTLLMDELLAGGEEAETERDWKKYEISCRKILDIYRGHFLMNEKDYPWTISITEKYKMAYSSVVEGYGSYLEKNGEWENTIKHYNNAILVDDSAEIPYKRLMFLYEKAGRPVDAVKIYQRYENILNNTIGIRPSPEMRALYDTIIKTVSI